MHLLAFCVVLYVKTHININFTTFTCSSVWNLSTFTKLYNNHYIDDLAFSYVCMCGSVHMSTGNMVARRGRQSFQAGVLSNQV